MAKQKNKGKQAQREQEEDRSPMAIFYFKRIVCIPWENVRDELNTLLGPPENNVISAVTMLSTSPTDDRTRIIVEFKQLKHALRAREHVKFICGHPVKVFPFTSIEEDEERQRKLLQKVLIVAGGYIVGDKKLPWNTKTYDFNLIVEETEYDVKTIHCHRQLLTRYCGHIKDSLKAYLEGLPSWARPVVEGAIHNHTIRGFSLKTVVHFVWYLYDLDQDTYLEESVQQNYIRFPMNLITPEFLRLAHCLRAYHVQESFIFELCSAVNDILYSNLFNHWTWVEHRGGIIFDILFLKQPNFKWIGTTIRSRLVLYNKKTFKSKLLAIVIFEDLTKFQSCLLYHFMTRDVWIF